RLQFARLLCDVHQPPGHRSFANTHFDRASPPRSKCLAQSWTYRMAAPIVPRRPKRFQHACHAGLCNWPEQSLLLLTRAESPYGNMAPPHKALLCMRIYEYRLLVIQYVNAKHIELRISLL